MVIATDHQCWKCRYNVRGLSETGVCPECGAEIDLSRFPRQFAIVKAVESFAIAALVFLIGGIVFLDLTFAASVHVRFLAVTLFIAAVVAIPAWLISRRRMVAWLFFAISALLLVLPYVPHTLVKSYGQFYAGIKPGMTRTEVFARLDDYYPDRGNTSVPTIRVDRADRLSLTLGGDSMSYNAELIVIRFTGGVVSSKSYHPD